MLSVIILNVVAPINGLRLQNKLELKFDTFNEIWTIWCTIILSTCHLIYHSLPMDMTVAEAGLEPLTREY